MSPRIHSVVIAALAGLLSGCLTLGAGGDDTSSPWDAWTPPPQDTPITPDTPDPEDRYVYVMVVDRLDQASAETATAPGVDVDAIELLAGGLSYYASTFHAAAAGPVIVTGPAADFTKLLHGFEARCSVDNPSFASFGGAGGAAVVSFGNNIEISEGDEITVYECGGDQDPDGMDDPYDAFVGVAPSIDDVRWVPCIQGAIGTTTCVVPALPDPTAPAALTGSCQFDGVCVEFASGTSETTAELACAVSPFDATSGPGTLSAQPCASANSVGACSAASPPRTTDDVYLFSPSFPDPQTACETTLALTYTPSVVVVEAFRHVLIVDRSPTGSASGFGGVDLDAVQIARGSQLYSASTVVELVVGPTDTSGAALSDEALGLPEHTCDGAAPTFSSLGGQGGSLVLSFDALNTLEAGDALTVFECDGARDPGGALDAFGAADSYDVYVGAGVSVSDASWVPCVIGGRGIETCLVPALEGPDTPSYGSCDFGDGQCASFQGAVTSGDAAAWCAGNNAAGLVGVLSATACAPGAPLGACASHTPPDADDLVIAFSASFRGNAQAACEQTWALTWTPDPMAAKPYLYVLVEDAEDPATASDGRAGVDIDAIALQKGGLLFFATDVFEVALGSGEIGNASDASLALGAPQNSCSLTTPTYVSLGGAPGLLAVSFGDVVIEEGDILTVYECGKDQTPSATDELYHVSVGVDPTSTSANWVRCLEGGVGIGSCVVPTLPVVGP